MKIVKILVLLTLLITVGCAGNKVVKTPKPQDKTFMWEIEGGESKLYLLGSIHLMPKSVYPLNEVITSAFEEADILAVEADASKIDQTKVQKLVMDASMYKDGKTLKSEISPELYTRLEAELTKFGMSMDQMNMFKPWYVSLTLSILEIQKSGTSPELGIDMHFLKLADEKGIEVVELESVYGQLELLTTIPDESQEGYLKYTLDNFEDTEELFATMVNAWKTGDADAMYNATKKKMKELNTDELDMSSFYQKLFPDRDNRIVEKLDTMLKSTDGKIYFVVVGAGHLIGDDGLLQLLKNKGYTTVQK